MRSRLGPIRLRRRKYLGRLMISAFAEAGITQVPLLMMSVGTAPSPSAQRSGRYFCSSYNAQETSQGSRDAHPVEALVTPFTFL
jgi:hypothetical protein